ncbi:tetraacyldisaccharide 4'-kinase [Herbaspirillum sp. RTI4]|uniref:tetraacyldisaccharide 4'-kinase n=1 Tax=Herbaspirillum sp. RTI4 TaxID=3048640 RepID=UPI002AB58656|nr:tetraacyldisaccharide 4'-kinase [Herbaspirillum sp. RTI4]MDY7577902.1 tetraacyldisaccharide 4'-kinase [Herbaspirillum sp. RTI4]MEA9981652.1 tetraacyldisaccharide 4'-kinase [Herbaspirillum sp. RTI4]
MTRFPSLTPMREAAGIYLINAWQRRGWLAGALWPLSQLYAAVTALRRASYRRGCKRGARLPVPVIVVGNIFVGGTGKTPLTIWLVDLLQRNGYTPGVISRGYGGTATMPQLASGAALAGEVGDEPLLIAARSGAPVMVGRRRVEAGRALLQSYPQVDVIISDDGLQHYALERDIEIVLFDVRGTGNGWLLPAGPLREPATRRRDFTVLNVGNALPAEVDNAAARLAPSGGPFVRMRLSGAHAEQLSDRRRQLPLAGLAELAASQGHGIAAVAGIGNPSRFFAMLSSAGLQCECVALPDHYNFLHNPFAALTEGLILITEKDAVKCQSVEAIRNDPRIWIVPVTAHIDGAFAEQLLEKLRESSSA